MWIINSLDKECHRVCDISKALGSSSGSVPQKRALIGDYVYKKET